MIDFALGDIVWTPDGYGRVVNVEDHRVTVWVFGEHVKRYAAESIRREIDPTPPHFGIGIIQRQAAIIRHLQKQLEALRQALEVYKQGSDRIKEKINMLNEGGE